MSAAAPRFVLVTEWVLATSVERVFDALVDPASWPRWWRYVERVALLVPGDAQGVGAVRRYTWSSRLPYRLTIDMTTTLVVPYAKLEGLASGDVEGTGCWRLHDAAGRACVRYTWKVAPRKRWMRALTTLAPLFVWNHHAVMAAGGRGLARHLGVPLVAHRRAANGAADRIDREGGQA